MMRSTFRNFLLASTVACAAIPPIAILSIETKGARVSATIVVANNSDFDLAIESYNVFADGNLTSPVFTVECDGRKVAYSGPMLKRRRPIAEDYIRIPAHERRSFTTNLAKSYSFPSGHHSCSVLYEAMYTLPAKDASYTLRSDPVTFKR
jgi:hypothetical protein